MLKEVGRIFHRELVLHSDGPAKVFKKAVDTGYAILTQPGAGMPSVLQKRLKDPWRPFFVSYTVQSPDHVWVLYQEL